MYKFQFFTTSDRSEPSWDHVPSADHSFAGMGKPGQQVVWDAIWSYCCGRAEPSGKIPPGLPETPAAAAELLHGGADRVISDCHFRKTPTEYDRKSGIKRLSCTAK
jgi:hypothetical protein